MRARVWALRSQGVPVQGSPKPLEGVASLEDRASLGMVLKLQDTKGVNLLPPLVKTSLVALSSDGTIVLSGFEAAEDVPIGMGPLVLQQWKLTPATAIQSGVTVEAVVEVEDA